ncbi:hypothetical protein C8F04DRAFT_1404607 [Mycena alexandri]|uniref:Uncharacterized protein n=1 Tax=Mycena alexandri TaxID=1745969 RepID=A0AAD6WN67_9AGAR|nr:hypothetical protein C8F04DRAFT_1404607 [Mycena alexandri]
MLPSLTTSKRRRGLRGKASRERLPAADFSPSTDSSLYSLSISGRSSLASTRTISKTSMATSVTSLSLVSSDHGVEEPSTSKTFGVVNTQAATQPSYRPPPPNALASLSAIEIFRQRLVAGGKHTRKESSGPPVRVVGRGGQGSRPRALPADNDTPALSAPPIMPLPARDFRGASVASGSTAVVPTRILGRGGVGSRPRGLLASETPAIQFMTPPPPTPQFPRQRPVPLIQEIPETPVLYRPGGRGGAGSRPRKAKPRAEKVKEDKDFRFPWKGKGKEGKGKGKAESPAIAMHPLSRTDTQASDLSAIAFAPPATRLHQKPINPDPPTPMTSTSGQAVEVGSDERQQTIRMNSKLARTLGTDFSFGWAQTGKFARRSSISVPESPIDDTNTTSSEYSMRRQSSYGSLLQHSRDISSVSTHSSNYGSFHREVWDSNEYGPSSRMDALRSPTPSSSSHYPTPPRPPQAFPDAPEYDGDDASEILSFHESDDLSFSHFSYSSAEINVQPHFEIQDTDDEYDRSRTLTPTQFAPPSRAETPLFSDDRQRFESPFQVMPLFVVPWEPAGTSADDVAQSWSGEWNQKDMQSVIQSLRTLKH